MKRLFKWNGIVLAILVMAGVSGCKNKADKLKPVEVPALALKSLTICGVDAASGSIEVEKAKTEIKANDIKAIFDYGTEKDKLIPVIIENGTLKIGENTVTLSVLPIKNKYKGWSKEITVERLDDPELILKSLTIFGIDAASGSIEVEKAKTEIKANDVKAIFGYGTEKDKLIPVIIENGTLKIGENTVTLSAAPVEDKYKGWSKEITVNRQGDPELILKSLTIFGLTVENNGITVENTHIKIEANDVKAIFDYGTEKDKLIPVTVKNGTLKKGENTVTLSAAPVEDKYKGWSKEITVKRLDDPKLILKSLTICGRRPKYGDFIVANEKTILTASDVIATFDYGTEEDKLIPVTVENGTLNVGENLVRLSVESVDGKYKEWSEDFYVKRSEPEPELILDWLTISMDLLKTERDSRDATHGSVTVGNEVTEITEKNILASFDYGDKKGFRIDVTVENGTLAVGSNTVKLSVPFDAAEHKAWSMNLNVIRNTLPNNSLVPVTPPAGGIVGSAAKKEDFPFLDENNYRETLEDYQGVFIEGRTVILSPFDIAETETTYALWKEVYDWATDAARGANKYTFTHSGKMGSGFLPPGWPNGTPQDKTETELEPVTEISWWDCLVWCNAYTEKTYGTDAECVYRISDTDNSVLRNSNAYNVYFDKTKKGFRLPTEAEWEYAARVQTDGTLCPLTYMSGAMGDHLAPNRSELADYVAWWGWSYYKTHAVKAKAANALGLYDMSGNVEELVWDGRGSVSTGTVTDPALRTGCQVIRGGEFKKLLKCGLVGARNT